MAEKRYYWLKLKDDFFRQKPIKKLRSMEHGETYTIPDCQGQSGAVRVGGGLRHHPLLPDLDTGGVGRGVLSG